MNEIILPLCEEPKTISGREVAVLMGIPVGILVEDFRTIGDT